MSSKRRSLALARAEDAVSPVVGAVLTMSIVVGAIIAVMMWGVPTLQKAQSQAAVDSVVQEMTLLDDVIDDLAQSGGGVAAEATFSYDRGSMSLTGDGDRWIVSYTLDSDAAIRLEDVSDVDHTYTLKNEGSSTIKGIKVEHSRVADDGQETLNQVDVGDLAPGETAEVDVRDPDGLDYPLEQTFVRAALYQFGVSEDNLVGDAWIVDTGAVRYERSAPAGFYRVRLVNGGVAVDEPHGSRMENLGAVKHVDAEAFEQARVFVNLQRVTPGENASITAGPGSWRLGVVSAASRPLTDTGSTVHDLDVRVVDDSEFWRRHLYLEHARPGMAGYGYDLVSPFDQTDDGLHADGPLRLSLFYQHARFPSGFEAS